MRFFSLLIACLFLSAGCAAGVRNLGSTKLLDGRTVEAIQLGTVGQDSPKLVAITEYLYDPVTNVSTKTGEFVSSGSSLLSDILIGTGSAALIAGGRVGAAALRRPDKTSIAVSQGGSSHTYSGGTDGDVNVNTNADSESSGGSDGDVHVSTNVESESSGGSDGDVHVNTNVESESSGGNVEDVHFSAEVESESSGGAGGDVHFSAEVESESSGGNVGDVHVSAEVESENEISSVSTSTSESSSDSISEGNSGGSSCRGNCGGGNSGRGPRR